MVMTKGLSLIDTSRSYRNGKLRMECADFFASPARTVCDLATFPNSDLACIVLAADVSGRHQRCGLAPDYTSAALPALPVSLIGG
jgi:hypothetical protein